MLLTQRKKLSTFMMGKAKKPDFVQSLGEPSEQTEQTEATESDDSVGLKSAAEKMLSAFEKKDASSLVSALSDFISMYQEPEVTEKEDDEGLHEAY